MSNLIDDYETLLPKILIKRRRKEACGRVKKGNYYRLCIEKKKSKTYSLTRHLKIIDDNGNLMEPSLKLTGTSDYWAVYMDTADDITPLSITNRDLLRKLTSYESGNNWKKPDGPKPEGIFHRYIFTSATGSMSGFTKGLLYKHYLDNNRIVNDNGSNMVPVWKRFEFLDYGNDGLDHEKRQDTVPEPKPEEKHMKIEITNPTLINGTDVDGMTDGDLIHHIKEVETAIEKLEKVKTPSTKISKLIKQHEMNAKKLVKILDARK